jgi:transcriptional regulator with XRE-family HTH domain
MIQTVYLDGDKLRRTRVLAGFSQRQLATRAGVSSGTVATLEKRGRNDGFHPQTLTKLAKALGVPPIDLIQGD